MIKDLQQCDFSKTPLTRMQAIRLMCIQCMGMQSSLVAECDSKACPLFPYRMGKSPKIRYKLNTLTGEFTEIIKQPFAGVNNDNLPK